MSRYVIDGHHPDHHIVVGWDNPLETFFLQVDDRTLPDDEDHGICWRGTHPQELPTVRALAQVMHPYATLTTAMTAQLQQDADDREPPTPLQRFLVRRLHHLKTRP